MLKKLRALAKKEYEDDDWRFHMIPMVKYSLKLAKIYKADKETVEIAALLHDIGRARHGGKDHDKTGPEEAEKILKDLGCSEDIIDEVKHCIRSHRQKDVAPETRIAKIISNADAMSHFDIVPMMFYWRSKKQGPKDTFAWVEEKLDRDWNNKLTLPEAKRMTKEKYDAAKLIIDANKEYL